MVKNEQENIHIYIQLSAAFMNGRYLVAAASTAPLIWMIMSSISISAAFLYGHLPSTRLLLRSAVSISHLVFGPHLFIIISIIFFLILH